jgi:pimeloyl-ACP methyl ester carboxylesterase
MKFKLKRMAIIFASALIFFFLLLLAVVFINSQGRPQPFVDNSGKVIEGSLAEKTFIKIGGVKQGMFIKSKDTKNPVLLYLHGGPSFSNYFMIEKYNPGLEDVFTVCYWEQRGGGLSFNTEIAKESITYTQLASDAIEVTNYLRERFGKEKIYIFAHSGGTPFALKAVSENPHLFHAYIAMAQITNQAESEKIAYEYMVSKAQESGDKRALSTLQKYSSVTWGKEEILTFFRSPARDNYMHKMGIGTMHNMRSIFTGVFVPVWMCNAYTFKEKFNIWKSKITFLPKTNIHKETIETDFALKVNEVKVPVYFFSGIHDLTVNISLSKEYYKKLIAPVKGFYTFENSAHSPLFEEPVKVINIIKADVLNGKNTLSDQFD